MAGVNPPDITPWFRTPDGVLVQNPLTRGYVQGVYVRQSWNLENRRALCSNSTEGYVLEFRPALPLTGGGVLTQGGYARGAYVRQSLCYYSVILLLVVMLVVL